MRFGHKIIRKINTYKWNKNNKLIIKIVSEIKFYYLTPFLRYLATFTGQLGQNNAIIIIKYYNFVSIGMSVQSKTSYLKINLFLS